MSLTLLASLIIIGLGFHQAYELQRLAIRAEDQKLEGKLEVLNQEVKTIFEARINALELIAEQITKDIETKPFKASNYYELLGFYVRKFNLNAAGLTDKTGKVLESYNLDPEVRKKFFRVNLYDHGFIEEINKRRTSVILPMRKGKVRPHKIMILAAPVWDRKTDQIVAYVGGSITPIDLQRLALRALENSPELKFMILDENKVAVTSDIISIKKDDPFRIIDSPLYRPSEQTTFTEGVIENGDESRVASRRVEFRDIHFTLAVSETLEYLHRSQRRIWKQTVLNIGLGVLICLFISYVISGPLTRPISLLVKGMKKIEEGRFSNDQDFEKPRFRETEEAWEALLSMEQKLRENRENLEREVRERTHQLIETHKDLDEQRSRALEATRLAALGEMAGGIAHEINNPLSVILASAERQLNRIKRNQLDLEQVETSFRLIESTSTRIAKIVQGLRTFSSAGGREPFEVVTVESILSMTLTFCLEKFKHHNIDFRVSEYPSDLTLECCPTQISQVLLNLLNNAFDAVSESQEKWIFIDVHDRHEYVEIAVSDSGPGIGQEIQEKIFRPFFTTKEIGKGTGLGLSITKGIIEKHNGKIFLKKNASYTSFIVHLPKLHA